MNAGEKKGANDKTKLWRCYSLLSVTDSSNNNDCNKKKTDLFNEYADWYNILIYKNILHDLQQLMADYFGNPSRSAQSNQEPW